MTEIIQEPVDPNQLLQEIRELIAEYPDNAYLAMMLRNKFTLLDEILSNGNPGPKSWDGGPKPNDWNWNPLYPNQRIE